MFAIVRIHMLIPYQVPCMQMSLKFKPIPNDFKVLSTWVHDFKVLLHGCIFSLDLGPLHFRISGCQGARSKNHYFLTQKVSWRALELIKRLFPAFDNVLQPCTLKWRSPSPARHEDLPRHMSWQNHRDNRDLSTMVFIWGRGRWPL